MNFAPGEKAVVRILTAGDEMSLEQKINEYLEAHRNELLQDLQVEQVEYHARTGSVEFGLIAVLVMKVQSA